MKLNNPDLFQQKALINGQWVDANDGRTVDVRNPATGEVIGTVPLMGTDETKAAIAAAAAAFPGWARKTAKERAVILKRYNDLLLENVDDLALIMTTEQGKSLAEAKGEVIYAASFIEWFAEEGKRTYGDVIPSPLATNRIFTIKQPIGVVGAITPWNFPAAMLTRKTGPALAAGCTVVAKPANETPFTMTALGRLGQEAGLPAGVQNIITGQSAAIGAELCSSDDVRKITFTGSTEVGRLLMRQCADTVKKMSLELGGNAAFIVFDDADIDAAVVGAMICKYRNSGQTCVCANRIYVQAPVYDEFCEKFAAAVGKLKVGNGVDEGTTQGPLINVAAVEKVEEHVADAIAKGGTLLAGGKRHALGGNFFEPTIVGNATADMLVAREETFGPLAPIFKFDTEEEVLGLVNNTVFGLASYFYARDMGRVWRMAEAIETGIIGVNTGIISTEVAPFGGVKQSGLGREGSKYGIEDYMEIKYINMAI